MLLGDMVDVQIMASIRSSSKSARSDIGLWIAMDAESNARTTGTCNHYWFPQPSSGGDLSADYDAGELPEFYSSKSKVTGSGDMCGDVGEQTPFGVAVTNFGGSKTISIPCLPELDFCFSWKVPGQETMCPLDGDETDGGYRKGTVPGTRSKCKCQEISTGMTINNVDEVALRKQEQKEVELEENLEVLCE